MERFEGLNEEKRKRILNAAMGIFSRDGYRKASTNEIIREAGISKGILFHYFRSKSVLYEYLYKQSAELLSERIFEKLDYSVRDPLDRIRRIVIYKIQLSKEYPSVFEFAKVAYYETDPEVKGIIREYNEAVLSDSYARVFQGIDVSCFRPELKPELVLQTMTATLENWSIGYMEQHKTERIDELNETEMVAAIEMYIDFFRKSFYR